MEPNKFDKYLKDKFDQRVIQPSDNAWKSLEGRLNDNDKNNPRKGYWWLAVAAGFIGILFIMTIMNNTTETENNSPVIVETEADEIIDSVSKEDENETKVIESELQIVQKKAPEKKEPPLKNDKVSRQFLVQNQLEKSSNKTDKTLVQQREKEQKPLISDTSEVKTAVSFEDQKVLDVVHEIKALQEKNQSVSEQEINALLVAAQKEINMQKTKGESSNTINADALLKAVESDLDASFRTRVFKVLQSGYENVKTAVAERNN